jgi:hypothetical protein
VASGDHSSSPWGASGWMSPTSTTQSSIGPNAKASRSSGQLARAGCLRILALTSASGDSYAPYRAYKMDFLGPTCEKEKWFPQARSEAQRSGLSRKHYAGQRTVPHCPILFSPALTGRPGGSRHSVLFAEAFSCFLDLTACGTPSTQESLDSFESRAGNFSTRKGIRASCAGEIASPLFVAGSQVCSRLQFTTSTIHGTCPATTRVAALAAIRRLRAL